MVGCSDQSDVEAGGGLVILFHAAGVAPGCKRGIEHGNAIFAGVYAHRPVFGVCVCDLLLTYLSMEQWAWDREARLIISRELGYEREQVTAAHLGR